jgi:type 1 fimbria pilin
MNGVFTTSLAGVGMRMRDSSGKPLNASATCSTDASLGNTGTNGSFNVSGTVELVKTGVTTSGTITTGWWATGILNTGVPLNGGSNSISIAGAAIRPVSCSVTTATANQTIRMLPVKTSAFGSAGATAGMAPFTLGLSCESGVKVAVTFSSTTGSSGIPSVIASNGTATGVGIQLLGGSQTPINLDTALQLTSGTTGNMSFQFYGQYYQLGAAQVTPGTVNASAIFTMSYQ